MRADGVQVLMCCGSQPICRLVEKLLFLVLAGEGEGARGWGDVKVERPVCALLARYCCPL
jgi:hypothetical protein